jgi:hypothetical protein
MLQALKDRGTKVLNPFDVTMSDATPEAEERRQETVKAATLCDVFLTGTNSITQDGRIVNVDAVGNRVAGMFWGHPRSIVVVGRNNNENDYVTHRLAKPEDLWFHAYGVTGSHVILRHKGKAAPSGRAIKEAELVDAQEAMLLHARYPFEDRGKREKAVLEEALRVCQARLEEAGAW